MDISGYKLSDSEAVRHVFAPRTVLPPFEAAIVFGGGAPKGAFGNAAENNLVFKASSGGLSLNNGGDTIRLEDPAGHVAQEIKFGAAEGNQDQSVNRAPDVDGATFLPHALVALDGGRLFSPGTRATGEAFTTKPRVVSIAPASMRKGSPAFAVTLSGASFVEGALVIFDGVPLATVYRSATEVEAQVSGSSSPKAARPRCACATPGASFPGPLNF
jgi:hypothetical protein